jgi:DNA-binding IclR family transcriptional regulator
MLHMTEPWVAYSCVMSNKRGDGSGGSGVQSVDRAISVLEILARRGEAGVSEVAAEISVHKSTAFRLLGALEGRGLVEQTTERGKYRLGFGIVRLAGAFTGRMDVTGQSRAVCERLARELGETVNIAVLQGHHVVNLDQVRGPSAVTAYNWVGQLTPLHTTSSGKVLLAHLSDKRRAELISAAGLARFTPNTVTTRKRLAEHLSLARTRGYAIAVEEYEIGLNAIAAPIRAQAGEVVAAVSVSGPAYRLAESDLHSLAPVLLGGADEISHRLGFPGH